MQYIDAHCHLDLYDDPAREISLATSADVGVFAVTNAPFVYEACRKIAAGTANIWVAVGLHPQLVSQYAHQVQDLVRSLDRTRFIGEVGLDYRATDPETHRTQRDVLNHILQASSDRGNCVLSIHSRGAHRDIAAMLEHGFRGTVILHWYSGGIRRIESLQGAGSYFSVNSAMMSSKKGRELVSHLDKSRVLTESDGPFVKIRGNRARPCDVRSTVKQLAQLWRVDECEACSLVGTNWKTALGSTSESL